MVVDTKFDEVYQFAPDMGSAGYVFTGENDANIIHNSALFNLNMLEACYRRNVKRTFYSLSTCIYPKYNNQEDPENLNCAEDSAYPAFPDSEYGWEKLFSERLYLAFHRNVLRQKTRGIMVERKHLLPYAERLLPLIKIKRIRLH